MKFTIHPRRDDQFTAEELTGVQSIKIIALDDSLTINNLLNEVAEYINN